MTLRRFAVPLVLVLPLATFVRADDDATPPAPPVEKKAEVGVVFESGTPKFEDVLAKAKAAGKPVFIDFTTDWCGWCRKLEADTYSQASVGDAMKAFVCVMIDAEKGEGVEIAKRYGAHSYPTLVIVDSSGDEIDRISGYRPPAAFLADIARIQKGEGTLASLKKAYESAPDDVAAGVAFAGKLAASKPEESSALFDKLSEKAKDPPTKATLLLERAALKLESARTKDDVESIAADAETIVKDYAETPAAAHVASRLGRAVAFLGGKRALAFLDAARDVAKDPKELVVVESLTISVHKQSIAAALKRQGDAAGDDPQALNEAAWTCFEMKMNVKQAIGWARAAVEKSNREPAILDTLANLLWLSAKTRDEALKLEEEAASKVADAAMKKEFAVNVAKWKAEMKVAGAKKEGDEDGEEDDGDDEK